MTTEKSRPAGEYRAAETIRAGGDVKPSISAGADVHREDGHPMTTRIRYNGQLAKMTCPGCGRPGSVVVSDFTMLPHRDRSRWVDEEYPWCRGPVCTRGHSPCPELVFVAMLDTAGLALR